MKKLIISLLLLLVVTSEIAVSGGRLSESADLPECSDETIKDFFFLSLFFLDTDLSACDRLSRSGSAVFQLFDQNYLSNNESDEKFREVIGQKHQLKTTAETLLSEAQRFGAVDAVRLESIAQGKDAGQDGGSSFVLDVLPGYRNRDDKR